MKAYVDEIESPAGPLAFAVNEDGSLVRLHFVESDYGPVMEEDLEDEGYAVETDETRTAGVRKELAEYVSGRRKTFDVPLAFAGSEWQNAVWMELTRIPFGETRSYGEVADSLGRPGAARAVGRANASQRPARGRTLPPGYRRGRHARWVQRWPSPQAALARARAQRTRRGGQLVCRKCREWQHNVRLT